MDLKKIAEEIREIVAQKQKELHLTFEEEAHKYTMMDLDGEIKSDFPSVSKVMKLFYAEFPTEQAAYNKAGGDPDEAERLMEEWAEAGRKSTNLGSRCHYFLEEHTLSEFGVDKEVRQPFFDCDAEQIIKSDTMIVAGKRYLFVHDGPNPSTGTNFTIDGTNNKIDYYVKQRIFKNKIKI